MRRKVIRTDPVKAIGYIRVSTEEQSLGPVAQREALVRWCKAHGLTLAAVFEDQISGGADLDKRTVLLDAIEALGEHGAGVLLVAKRDRLARDTMYAAMIERLVERKGARVQSADGIGSGDSPEAQLMRGIVDLFAQYERALIRTRTRAALAVKRTRREFTGGHAPYGWRVGADGIHLEPEPAEQRVIRLVRSLRADGRTLQAICDELAKAFRPRTGRQWFPMTIACLLKAEVA